MSQIFVSFEPGKVGPMHAMYVVTDAEAHELGLKVGGNVNGWGDILAPLLWEKGCPKEATQVGNFLLQMQDRPEGANETVFVLFERAA